MTPQGDDTFAEEKIIVVGADPGGLGALFFSSKGYDVTVSRNRL